MRIFEEEEKAYITMSYTVYGVKHSVDFELDHDCTWPEVLGPIICNLEAAFGYAFDLNEENLGIYYKGKPDA